MDGTITNVTMMRSKLPLKCSFDVKKRVIASKQNERGKCGQRGAILFFFKKNLLVSFSFFLAQVY